MNYCFVVTAAGRGSRMKSVSPLPKYMLHFRGKRIIDHLVESFNPIVLSTEKMDVHTNIVIPKNESRKETLEHISELENVFILDCDIFVPKFLPEYGDLCLNNDILYKWNGRNAGIYFVKSISRLLKNMKGDDIVSGMVDYEVVQKKTIHLGTPQEYYKALKQFEL